MLTGATLLVCAGGLVQAQVQVVVPGGIESVNGSSVDMGCTSPLVDSGGMMVCGGCSYLNDGVSPDIDTSTSDWASQLVTVRRNEGTQYLDYPHVLLTFGFNTAVSLTGIEMDLFLCPDWNIDAPTIIIYLDSDYNLVYQSGLQFVEPVNSPQSSCVSLSTVTFTESSFLTGSYRTIHILVDQSVDDSIEWVHVGEVRFLGIDTPTCLQSTTSTFLLPSSCDETTFPSLSSRKHSANQTPSPLLHTTTSDAIPVFKSYSSATTISLSSSGE